MFIFTLRNVGFTPRRFYGSALLLIALAAPAQAQQNPAPHVHGAAALEVAVEENGLHIDFDSPLDNLLGFEHAPDTDAQRQAVKDLVARLQQADTLFVAPAAAKCQTESVKLNAPVLPAELLGNAAETTTAEPADGDGHAELEATIVFRCTNPAALKSLEIELFNAFSNLHSLDAAVVTDQSQSAAKLSAKAKRLSWK